MVSPTPPKGRGAARVLSNDLPSSQAIPRDAAALSSVHSLDRAGGLVPGPLSCLCVQVADGWFWHPWATTARSRENCSEQFCKGELQCEWQGGERSNSKIIHRYKMSDKKCVARKALKTATKLQKMVRKQEIRK